MTNDLVARHATVGEIAASMPGATAVFRRFGMDFCCKGNVALDESARQRGNKKLMGISRKRLEMALHLREMYERMLKREGINDQLA